MAVHEVQKLEMSYLKAPDPAMLFRSKTDGVLYKKDRDFCACSTHTISSSYGSPEKRATEIMSQITHPSEEEYLVTAPNKYASLVKESFPHDDPQEPPQVGFTKQSRWYVYVIALMGLMIVFLVACLVPLIYTVDSIIKSSRKA